MRSTPTKLQVAVSLALNMLPLCLSACGAPPTRALDLAQARRSYARCVVELTNKLDQISGLLPEGIAYMVGFACSSKRDQYRLALVAAKDGDPEHIMNIVDHLTARFTILIRNGNVANKLKR